MKHSQIEIALLRKGVSPSILHRDNSAFRQSREHGIAKLERQQPHKENTRKRKKRKDEKAGRIYTIKGVLLSLLFPNEAKI